MLYRVYCSGQLRTNVQQCGWGEEVYLGASFPDSPFRKMFPHASDVVPGMGSCPVVPDQEPLEHFEYVRSVQKEYWSCETYMRVCFLFGKIHLIQAFNYWL
eukprot:2196494-Amphidinium_carterae.1